MDDEIYSIDPDGDGVQPAPSNVEWASKKVIIFSYIR